MISLLYNTERCLDGLTVVDGYFRPLSERREPVHVVTADLENPVVLQLVNARDDLLPFMSRYSAGDVYSPSPGPAFEVPIGTAVGDVYTASVDPGYEPNVHIGMIAGWQRILRDRLISAGKPSLNDPYIRAHISLHLRDGKPQMLVRCHELFELMRLEVATIVVEGAKVVICERCKNLFLAGRSTSRRSDATFCSDRCRVAAMRARKKESR
jgi:hypothetical protein